MKHSDYTQKQNNLNNLPETTNKSNNLITNTMRKITTNKSAKSNLKRFLTFSLALFTFCIFSIQSFGQTVAVTTNTISPGVVAMTYTLSAATGTANTTLNLPVGVTSVQVECWGGGGGGGSVTGVRYAAGGGGSGGAYVKGTVTGLSGGTAYNVTVGGGGASASAGNPSYFGPSGSSYILAQGGTAGTINGTAGVLATYTFTSGGVASTASCVVPSGGTAVAGSNGNTGSGTTSGTGGAGVTSNPSLNGSAITGGTGGTGSSNAAGGAGAYPGPGAGGGGGCNGNSTTNPRAGGTGNRGEVIIQYTNVTPATPSNLSFTNVGTTSMTLNWTDNANNEDAYVIKYSTDGVTYATYATIAANSQTTNVTGLTANTLYYFQVYASVATLLSNPLSGIKSTLGGTVYSSSNTFTPPAGVYNVKVECWGGGGGGGGNTSVGAIVAAGGGGGGAYKLNSSVAVTPGTPYTITVGAGGTGGPSTNGVAAGTGGTSSGVFGGTTVSAVGGAGGLGTNSTGVGGAGGVGTFNGGTGGTGGGTYSGSGGGSAGFASNGNNGSSTNVATAAVAGGGTGAAGVGSANNGNTGGVPGGGGSGSTGFLSAKTGGAGGAGQVIISFILPTITSLGSTSGCGTASLTINGTNLEYAVASGVTIGGVAVTAITSQSPTKLVVTPVNGSSGAVVVTANGNISQQAFSYTSNPTPALIATPSSQTACSGVALTTINLSSNIAGTSTPLAGTTFSWTSNSPSGISGTPISGVTATVDGTLSNSNSSPTLVTVTINGSSSLGCPASPITATVNVNPSNLFTTQPSASTICQTNNTSFTVASSAVSPAYQWYNNSGTGFNPISNGSVYGGATSATLTLSNPPLSMSGYTYECIVTTTCSSTQTSNVVLLTINPTPIITVSPTTQTLCAGIPITSIVFSDANTASAGSSTFSYTSTVPSGIGGTVPASGTTSPIGDGTTQLFTSTNLTATTVTYTITSTAGSCPAIAQTATVIVNPGLQINTQPSNQVICQTYNATFSVAVAGGGITYQWQESTDGGVTFNNITD